MVLTYSETPGRAALAGIAMGLSGSDYYGRNDDVLRADQLVQRAGLIELAYLFRQARPQASADGGQAQSLLRRLLRSINRRLLGTLRFCVTRGKAAAQPERNAARLLP
jgi:hypothetical protein